MARAVPLPLHHPRHARSLAFDSTVTFNHGDVDASAIVLSLAASLKSWSTHPDLQHATPGYYIRIATPQTHGSKVHEAARQTQSPKRNVWLKHARVALCIKVAKTVGPGSPSSLALDSFTRYTSLKCASCGENTQTTLGFVRWIPLWRPGQEESQRQEQQQGILGEALV